MKNKKNEPWVVFLLIETVDQKTNWQYKRLLSDEAIPLYEASFLEAQSFSVKEGDSFEITFRPKNFSNDITLELIVPPNAKIGLAPKRMFELYYWR